MIYLIVIKENTNNIDDFKYLYEKTFSKNINKELLKISLKNTFYSVSIYDNNKIIGYGRLLGDAIYYVHIHNIMVLPEYQNQKIGTKIMNTLLKEVTKIKKVNPDLKVYLASFKGKENFYKKFNFLTREELNMGKVMMLK